MPVFKLQYGKTVQLYYGYTDSESVSKGNTLTNPPPP